MQFSDWAAPIVPVLKPDGSVRICGYYKCTVNQVALGGSNPLPNLFASLAGEQTFSKLNLAHAYQQLKLDEESRKLVVINTPKGLCRYNHVPFGVSAAPAILQPMIEGILWGIQHELLLGDILTISANEHAINTTHKMWILRTQMMTRQHQQMLPIYRLSKKQNHVDLLEQKKLLIG